jgi:hypothetical protein
MGERWTPEMIAENDRAMKDLAHARKQLANHARAKLGLPAADLFAQVEASDNQGVVTNAPSADQAVRASQDGRGVLPARNDHSAKASS